LNLLIVKIIKKCQAEKKEKGIKCLPTNVKKDLEKTDIKRKSNKFFLDGLMLKVKRANTCAFNL